MVLVDGFLLTLLGTIRPQLAPGRQDPDARYEWSMPMADVPNLPPRAWSTST